MTDDNKRELEEYRKYLERLAESNSPDMFSNGGIKHASILMSVLFQDTDEARIYCCGFRPDLITTEPYWGELNNYLKNPQHILHVLIEQDNYKTEEPLTRLHEIMNQRQDETIQVRLISNEGKQMITDRFGTGHCNFAVFDGKKFRFEYDPDFFKAFGSFNQPDKCKILTELFDDAFNVSTPLWQN